MLRRVVQAFSLFFAVGLAVPLPARELRAAPQFEALALGRTRQNHLVVRAFINGKPALLGVDTGAPVSAIALNRRDFYGISAIPGTSKLPPRLMINGAFNAVGIAKSFRLGGLELMDEPMVAINLDHSSRAARVRGEQEIDGILGADILFPTRAVLDCQRQLLILNTEPQNEMSAPGMDYRGFQSVPMHVTEGFNLYVDGKVNGTPAQLMVDTGAFATLLHRSFVKQMRIPLRETPFSSAAVNLRERGVQIARIRSLSVGKVDFAGRNVGVIDLSGLIYQRPHEGSKPIAGLLGAELLQRHHGIIDFGTRRLYLKR